MAEEFAHQFHESVLQSTQKALQKHKGNEQAACPMSPVIVQSNVSPVSALPEAAALGMPLWG